MAMNRLKQENMPVVFMLHFLGGSARQWVDVMGRMEVEFRCVPIDLAGFGDAAGETGYTVGEMADAVVAVIRAEGASRWAMVGHSMGAKVAAVIARRAEDGEAGLAGLVTVITMAGSPPSPEPFEESRREEMSTWFTGDAAESREQATKFVEGNIAAALKPEVKERTVRDVLRMNRAAWVAWLKGGSKEDWADRVGVLKTPALVVAGEMDPDLGEAAQRREMLPHFAEGRLEVVKGARHLLPMERPEEVSRLIGGQMRRVMGVAMSAVDPEYLRLITSTRVSEATRAVLLKRAQRDDPGYVPQVLSGEEMATLRVVAAYVVPQRDAAAIDLAARMDAGLAKGTGDGWRFAVLPEDAQACAAGLRTLETMATEGTGVRFAEMDEGEAEAMLETIAEGRAETPRGPGLLDAEQMERWFEDVRGGVVREYMAHPATLARIGYSGIADGGDSETMQGFVQIGVGERETWEPMAKGMVTK